MISVITINRNNAIGLQKTIDSLVCQTYRNYELIVIDGGSTDSSIEIIKMQESAVAYWISEEDNGIYQAQNKGLLQAEGDYLLFLNSGDVLHSETVLERVSPYLKGVDIVYGDLQIKEKYRNWIKKYNENISFSYFLRDTLPHQGSFISRSLFERVGLYDESLKIASDWIFFVDATCRENASLLYLDFTIADYDYSGISSDPANIELIKFEKRAKIEKTYPRFVNDYDELLELRGKYPLLANSRAVKAYFKIRRLFKN